MKTVAQLAMSVPVTLPPDTVVSNAIEVMRRYRSGEIVIVEQRRVVGIVTARDLLGQTHYRTLGQIMIRNVATISPEAPITDAYKVIEEHGVDRLPVVGEQGLVGVITRSDILHELGQLTDPLTGLPWAGLLRQQAAELLRAGEEIVIIFIDLNRFRQVNKRLGHVIGDQVIVAVANALQRITNPSVDLLCRYGGDEFAIVTTRSADKAESVAQDIAKAIDALALPEMQGMSVTAAIGLAGGKRTTERTDAYPTATVDDLITLGSRASSAAKQLGRQILHAHEMNTIEAIERGGVEPRLRLTRTATMVQNDRIAAAVELEYHGRSYRGEAEGAAINDGVLHLLALAAVQALRRILPSTEITVRGIGYVPLPPGDAVSVALSMRTSAGQETLVGIAPSVRQRPDAVVRAALQALNRRLTPVLAETAERAE